MYGPPLDHHNSHRHQRQHHGEEPEQSRTGIPHQRPEPRPPVGAGEEDVSNPDDDLGSKNNVMMPLAAANLDNPTGYGESFAFFPTGGAVANSAWEIRLDLETLVGDDCLV